MELNRFSRPERIKSGGRERARRLRAEPTWTEAKLWERLRLLPIRIDSRRIPDDLDAVVGQIALAISQKSPLPLEGEGVGGWGARAVKTGLAHEAGSSLPRPIDQPSANTPSQPSPLEGEDS